MGAAVTALGFWIPSAGGAGWCSPRFWSRGLRIGGQVRLAQVRCGNAAQRLVPRRDRRTRRAKTLTHITSHTWAQTLAWLAGAVLWIAVTFIVWLARGRKDQPQSVPKIPGDTARGR
jgi:hypothetical protein